MVASKLILGFLGGSGTYTVSGNNFQTIRGQYGVGKISDTRRCSCHGSVRPFAQSFSSDFEAGLGTWPFCDQIVKIWPFSEVVWPRIFCLAFWLFLNIFENLA